jgi:hypothetical protein
MLIKKGIDADIDTGLQLVEQTQQEVTKTGMGYSNYNSEKNTSLRLSHIKFCGINNSKFICESI